MGVTINASVADVPDSPPDKDKDKDKNKDKEV